MDNERLIELLAMKISGEIDLAGRRELQALLQENPAFEHIALEMEGVMRGPYGFSPEVTAKETAGAWNRLQRMRKENDLSVAHALPARRIKRIPAILAVAAAIAAIVVSGVYFIGPKFEQQPERQNIVSTKKGSRSNLTLPDGSEVWLNADSKITYNENFGKGLRELTLTGEAYFDVVKDPAHPFVIHTPALDVRVLGTAFNVRAYPGESSTQTTLIRGSVEVSLHKNPEKKIMLKPDEKLDVDNDYATPASTVKPVAKREYVPEILITKPRRTKADSAIVETQWVKNRLAFSHDKLETIAAELGRWYGVEIKIADESLKEKEFSGVFEDESLPQILDALKLAGNFRYNINKNEVLINP